MTEITKEKVVSDETTAIGSLREKMKAHPDDVRLAESVAKGAGMTVTELAIRNAMDGETHTTKAALGALDLPEPIKFSFMATAYEMQAEQAERQVVSQGRSPLDGIELRKTSRQFRAAALDQA